MRLDPTSLKLFVCVVEEGTIAAAAERSHSAAAAVSKRVSELEAVLRTQLLTRTNKGVEPTAAGSALLNIARRALHELDEVCGQRQPLATQSIGWRGDGRDDYARAPIRRGLCRPLRQRARLRRETVQEGRHARVRHLFGIHRSARRGRLRTLREMRVEDRDLPQGELAALVKEAAREDLPLLPRDAWQRRCGFRRPRSLRIRRGFRPSIEMGAKWIE